MSLLDAASARRSAVAAAAAAGRTSAIRTGSRELSSSRSASARVDNPIGSHGYADKRYSLVRTLCTVRHSTDVRRHTRVTAARDRERTPQGTPALRSVVRTHWHSPHRTSYRRRRDSLATTARSVVGWADRIIPVIQPLSLESSRFRISLRTPGARAATALRGLFAPADRRLRDPLSANAAAQLRRAR